MDYRARSYSQFVMWLIAAMVMLPIRSNCQSLTSAEQSAWQTRLISIVPNGVDGARTVQSFVTLDPDSSFTVLKQAWPKIPSPETRLYLMNMLQDHPRVLDLLHLGITDSSLFVQNRALQALEMYSFESFAEDFSAYDDWRRKQVGRSLEDTIRESCRDYVASVARLDDTLRFQRLTILQRIAYNLGGSAHAAVRRKAMLESSLPEALAQWVTQPSTAWTSFAVLRNLRMDEAYLRRVVLPLADPKTEVNYRRQAIGVLANPDNRWAADLLLKMFVQEYPDPEAENIGYALTQIGDPHVLPTVISMIDTDKTADGQRVLGNILNLMTGNNSGIMHDGGWWRTWWTKNAGRFPAEVRAMPIPQLALRTRSVTPATIRGPEQHQIAGDFKRTYWLVGPSGIVQTQHADAGAVAPPAPPKGNFTTKAGALEAPALSRGDNETPGLLVVLPPDGNGSSAALFWQELEQKALKNRYYVAVAVAPKWVDAQATTWLNTETVKQVKEAKFTTEKFAAEIVKDVMATHTIQPSRVYLHGAAESGPVTYACSLDDSTPFKGFYILASAFRSAGLPPLSRARNRRYLIQHSPDDKTAPFFMAAAAQKLLTEQGATVKLESYKGAHGYVFSDPLADPVGDAMGWLDGSRK